MQRGSKEELRVAAGRAGGAVGPESAIGSAGSICQPKVVAGHRQLWTPGANSDRGTDRRADS